MAAGCSQLNITLTSECESMSVMNRRRGDQLCLVSSSDLSSVRFFFLNLSENDNFHLQIKTNKQHQNTVYMC